MRQLLSDKAFKTLTLSECLYLAKRLAKFELANDLDGYIQKYSLTLDQIRVIRRINLTTKRGIK